MKATQASKKTAKYGKRRPFPYEKVARLWSRGRTIKQIANAIGRFEKSAPDPLHSMRCFIHRMHTIGYKDAHGVTRRLPHRVSKAALRAATRAGRKAARG